MNFNLYVRRSKRSCHKQPCPRCAGTNLKGIYNQVKDAVQLKPDIGFDIISAA